MKTAEFHIGHHAREFSRQPVRVEQESEFGLLIDIPQAGWSVFLERDNDGVPILRTYRAMNDGPVHNLRLEHDP